MPAMHMGWFKTLTKSDGPAWGDAEDIDFRDFCDVLQHRREGEKDGCAFIPARFKPQHRTGRMRVRRLKTNLVSRTAIALDVELNKVTGELPPDLSTVAERLRVEGIAAAVYTSHSNSPNDPRYRVVLPLSAEIPPELPAPEVVADRLGLLGVLDHSKVGASSGFYLPSCPPGTEHLHRTIVLDGAPLNAALVVELATRLMQEREADQERIAAEAHAAAAARRAAKFAMGFNPDDSLIEKLRPLHDLEQVLLSHNYDKVGRKFRHSNSTSGVAGCDIKAFAGIERVFSHNGTDPLHASNLPSWCEVKAIDVIDAITVLDYGGDRARCLHELAKAAGLDKADERKVLARHLFELHRIGAGPKAIDAVASLEGRDLGLSANEIREVSEWVKTQHAAAA